MNVETKEVTKYNLAYINHQICSEDNGRVVGFDNSHQYSGFASEHHYRWLGKVHEVKKFISYDETSEQFQKHLAQLKSQYGKDY